MPNNDKITHYNDVAIDDLPRDLRFRPSGTENKKGRPNGRPFNASL